jgi:hypothetical protein
MRTTKILRILGQRVSVPCLSMALAACGGSGGTSSATGAGSLTGAAAIAVSTPSVPSSSSSSGGSVPGGASGGSSAKNDWSTMGVVADGVTDNTAALNVLPANVNIVGDCPAGGAIVLKEPWLWHSNMKIAIQPGCRIVSYVTSGSGASYAITQADLTSPLTNIYVDGLQISSYRATSEDIIMRLWVNNFSLLHWTVTASGGVMVIRGSNQEIAYGTATGTYPAIGNPGIRHVGNEPKVPTSAGQPANVYIHDNNIQSGDGTYQACQPLSSRIWTDVSSDDILYQNNVGSSAESALILIGERPQDVGPYSNWSCSNIVFDNVNGFGKNKSVYISSVGPSNPLSNIKFTNSVIDASGYNRRFGAVEITAVGGVISSLSFEKFSIKNVADMALTTVGSVTGLSFDHGEIDPPTTNGHATVVISDATQASITNSTIGANGGDALQIGPNDNTGVRHSVSEVTIAGNIFNGIGNNFAAVRMYSVSNGYIGENTMNSAAGATSSTGIVFSMSGPGGPGTTNTTAKGNNLSGINGAPKIIFPPNQGNTITDNIE